MSRTPQRGALRARIASPLSAPHTPRALALAAVLSTALGNAPVWAQSTAPSSADSLQELRQQLDEMRRQYDARIQALEARLQAAQRSQQPAVAATTPSAVANTTPNTTTAPAAPDRPAPLDPARPMARQGAAGFNPSVSAVLSGGYNGLSKDPETWAIPGFLPTGGEVGPGSRGLTLSESEITLAANVDHLFYGSLTLAVTPENETEVEEAYVQTTALPAGLRLKAGRFFAGLGYLNEQHAHAWDFVDAPLAHQALLGGQFRQEGLQARWVLPLQRYVELGMELGNGNNFPGSERNRNGAGALLLSAHTGGDIGLSQSWRAGVSWMRTRADGREWESEDPNGGSDPLVNSFTGRSRIWALDGVWKWAPNGNAKLTNVQLQGEYFRRQERGDVTYDTADFTGSGNSTDAYRSAQSGWYLQGVWQFMPQWRTGLRFDQLDGGSVNFGVNAALASADEGNRKPRRTSVMFD
ncbi:TonB-dependent receptor, partial [Aquabacterium sp. UBA2148]|uniref:TonB-dependent receptor n=1 Tax=Aquabacterium sp. UBA2148 TaxID=1946042 RepID=UPI002579C570